MRQIEQDMLAAIRDGRDWIKGNTKVRQGDGRAVVTLHGNPIAIVRDDHLHLTFAGWATPTTKGRLNALLAYFRPAPFTAYFAQEDRLMRLHYNGEKFTLDPHDTVQIGPQGVTQYRQA